MTDKQHDKHLEKMQTLAKDLISSKKKSEDFFKSVGIHDQDGNIARQYKTDETLTEGGNTIINTKELLKLKEEHLEMCELLKDIYDNGDGNLHYYQQEAIKELLDKILLDGQIKTS